MSSRRAARKMVSPSRMSISRSSMVKVLASFVLMTSPPTPQRGFQFFREIFQNTQQRIGRCLAKPTDRGITHQAREFRKQCFVPRSCFHQFRGLLGADPAGRALAAALVLEEPHKVK